VTLIADDTCHAFGFACPLRCKYIYILSSCVRDGTQAVANAAKLQHDKVCIVWILYCGAGVASSVEPQLRQLQLAAEQAGHRGRQAQGDGARGDALLVMPEGMLITDIVVAHPAAQSYLDAAARTDGAAAADHEVFKVQK
jgi:hypothetical protein